MFRYMSPTSLPTTRRQNPLDSYFHSHNRVTSRPRQPVSKVTISLIGFNLLQRTNLQRDSKRWTQFRTYISLTVQGILIIYIIFERKSLSFQIPPLESSPSRAVQQRQLRAKWLLCSTRFFALVCSLKLCRRLLCSAHFVFASTFNLQRGGALVVGIANLSK